MGMVRQSTVSWGPGSCQLPLKKAAIEWSLEEALPVEVSRLSQ